MIIVLAGLAAFAFPICVLVLGAQPLKPRDDEVICCMGWPGHHDRLCEDYT